MRRVERDGEQVHLGSVSGVASSLMGGAALPGSGLNTEEQRGHQVGLRGGDGPQG